MTVATIDNALLFKILTGSWVGETVIIPKIQLNYKAENVYRAALSQYQFSISFVFALKINKAQGQSMQQVSVFFPHPVYDHRQLYVVWY